MFPIQGKWVTKLLKQARFAKPFSCIHLHSNMGIYREDQRGKHSYRPNKSSKTQMDFVRRHIEIFPKTESHYCRKDTKRVLGTGSQSH